MCSCQTLVSEIAEVVFFNNQRRKCSGGPFEQIHATSAGIYPLLPHAITLFALLLTIIAGMR